jgi:putative ABC transport system permease protein
MLQIVLTLIWRDTRRHRFQAGIKIGGLAIGVAAALVAALLARDDLSYDRFFSDPAALYRISIAVEGPGLTPNYVAQTMASLGPWLNAERPGALAVTRLDAERLDIRYDGRVSAAAAYSADPNIFDIFDLKFVEGDPRHALDAPGSAVLTATQAQLLFGRTDVLGLAFEGFDHEPLRVTGILRDLPKNTHLDGEILVSGTTTNTALHNADSRPGPVGAINVEVLTYVRLMPGTTRSDLDQALGRFLAAHYPDTPTAAAHLRLSADPVTGIHLDPHGLTGRHGSDVNTVAGLGVVGLLLLLISIINYSTLVTAGASARLVEIGVRKSVGATRLHLFTQLLMETAVFSLLALALAITGVALILPRLNALLDRGLALDFRHDATLDGLIAAVFVAVTIGGGAYAAWTLAAQPASIALKRGKSTTTGRFRSTQALVVGQFAMGIGMIIATLVIYQQTRFATDTALKFDKDQVLLVRAAKACDPAFKQELTAQPSVLAVACSRAAPLDLEGSTSAIGLPDGRSVTAERQPVDFGFFALYRLPLRAGRDFSADRASADLVAPTAPSMTASVIINETAVRAFGFASPEAAVGQTVAVDNVGGEHGEGRPAGSSTIIGVVADFPVASIRAAIRPAVFYVDPGSFRLLSVKLRRDSVAAGVAAIDATWRRLGSDAPINRFFLDDRIQARYQALIDDQNAFLALSVLGLVVASIGLFGLAGFVAEARTKEMGIRKALGAGTLQLARLVVWQFVRPVLIANIIAWPIAAWLLQRWLDGFALRIDLDPLDFAASGGLALVLVVLLTSGHAAKVARARPVDALRYE